MEYLAATPCAWARENEPREQVRREWGALLWPPGIPQNESSLYSRDDMKPSGAVLHGVSLLRVQASLRTLLARWLSFLFSQQLPRHGRFCSVVRDSECICPDGNTRRSLSVDEVHRLLRSRS